MEFEKKKIQSAQLKGKVVLMRVDVNVPLDSNLQIIDDTRIQVCIPTIQYILNQGARVVLLAHMGRPKGAYSERLSVKHILQRLSELLGQEVKFAKNCIGEKTQNLKKKLQPGEVLLLENVRFYPAEENSAIDPTFSEQLARHCDLFVNDSFSTSHRNQVSTCEITAHFPKKSFMGLSLQKEETYLKKKLTHPKRPFVALIGGAKISSKIGVVKSILEKADAVLIGGAMAHTFLKAQGISLGKSLNEPTYEEEANSIIEACRIKNIPLILPVDLRVCTKISDKSSPITVSIHSIQADQIAVDVGPDTLKLYEKQLRSAQTVFWNGPLGITEIAAFCRGTERVAEILGSLQATTIVGGGDSVAALKKLNLAHKMTYISTGGGASLEYIEKGTLPGIESLSRERE